jgi:hypothetical protein
MSVRKNAFLLKLFTMLLMAAALPATVRGQHHHDHDVDVEVINTPNVKVVNTPSVNVNQLPAVQLAPGASVTVSGTPTVQVGNTAANPVLVHDTATPKRTPFQLELQVAVPDGFGGNNGFFTVPDGKRLVIEYASASGSSSNQDTLLYSIGTQDSSGAVVNHFLPATQLLDSGVTRFSIAGQTVKLYSEPASSVNLRVDRLGTTGADNVFFSISGYLEDLQ